MKDKEKKMIQLEKLMTNYLDYQDKLDKLNKSGGKLKDLIISAMKNLGITSYQLLDDSVCDVKKGKTFSLCKRINVTYDVKKIKNTLEPEEYKQFINSNVIVGNYAKFKKVMKKYGVPARDIKPLLIINEVVDSAKLQRLSEIGDIDLSEIKDCYTISPSAEYIMVKDIK